MSLHSHPMYVQGKAGWMWYFSWHSIRVDINMLILELEADDRGLCSSLKWPPMVISSFWQSWPCILCHKWHLSIIGSCHRYLSASIRNNVWILQCHWRPDSCFPVGRSEEKCHRFVCHRYSDLGWLTQWEFGQLDVWWELYTQHFAHNSRFLMGIS